jgi:hypothetical protein
LNYFRYPADFKYLKKFRLGLEPLILANNLLPNEADRRVLELLTEKFNLFNGVFGASDDVLGSIESGVDFEKRILSIYQKCRTPAEIDMAFKTLQAEMDERIQARMTDAHKLLLENFDEEVHERLRIQLSDAKAQLDRFSKRFWSLTHYMLHERAKFDDAALAFDLTQPPTQAIAAGRYHLISNQHLTQTSRIPQKQPKKCVQSTAHFFIASRTR